MAASIPEHVLPERVFDFDFTDRSELHFDPYKRVRRLFAEAPDIFYTPRNGGHWVVTRARLALEVLQRHEDFSSDPKYNADRMRDPKTLPNQVDPPEHTEYRRILSSWFTPRAVLRYEDDVRALSRDLIGGVLNCGQCEFVKEIGKKLPVIIFLRIVNAPLTDRERLIEIGELVVRGKDANERQRGWALMAEYLRPIIAARNAAPGQDLLSFILGARYQDRPLTEKEILGMVTLIVVGGLDTVASLLPFIMSYLAAHPEDYAKLVAAPDLIPSAVEELMRIHGIVLPERGVTRNLEFHGVHMRRMDRVMLPTPMYGFDDREVHDPDTLDFKRPPGLQLLFGGGAHRCLGSHLARLELKVFLQEWIKLIDRCWLRDGAPVQTVAGHVWTPYEVNLQWQRKADA